MTNNPSFKRPSQTKRPKMSNRTTESMPKNVQPQKKKTNKNLSAR